MSTFKFESEQAPRIGEDPKQSGDAVARLLAECQHAGPVERDRTGPTVAAMLAMSELAAQPQQKPEGAKDAPQVKEAPPEKAKEFYQLKIDLDAPQNPFRSCEPPQATIRGKHSAPPPEASAKNSSLDTTDPLALLRPIQPKFSPRLADPVFMPFTADNSGPGMKYLSLALPLTALSSLIPMEGALGAGLNKSGGLVVGLGAGYLIGDVINYLKAKEDPNTHISEYLKTGFRIGSDMMMMAPIAGLAVRGKMPFLRSLAVSGLASRVLVGTMHDLMPRPTD